MKSLEDVVREAATAGWLDRTTIVKDPSGRGWQVSTPSRFSRGAWAVEIDADPVAALRAALEPYGAPQEPPAAVPLTEEEMLS
jgi:hypothetical protein